MWQKKQKAKETEMKVKRREAIITSIRKFLGNSLP